MSRRSAAYSVGQLAWPGASQFKRVEERTYIRIGFSKNSCPLRMSGDWDGYLAFHKTEERLRNYPEWPDQQRLAA